VVNLVNVLAQIRDGNAQGFCELGHIDNSWVAFARFNVANVRPMNVRFEPERLLRPAELFAQSRYIPAQAQQKPFRKVVRDLSIHKSLFSRVNLFASPFLANGVFFLLLCPRSARASLRHDQWPLLSFGKIRAIFAKKRRATALDKAIL
jgi:hypothetical protein